MKKIMMLFFALLTSSLWGMKESETSKNWFITALNYRMQSNEPIVLCFQNVKDDISEIAMLKTVRKGIQAVAKRDSNVMASLARQSSGRGLNDEVKKNYADTIHNGWIALCINVPYSKAALMNVDKYYLSSRTWHFGQREVDCTLPQNCTYKDLEEGAMVVVNIPDGDNDSINSCFTLIRSLQAKGIPLLVNSDRRLLRDLWSNLSDLFPEKEEVQVFSNNPLCDNDNDDSDGHDAVETSSERSDSEDIFAFDDAHQQLDPKEDIFDYFPRLGDGTELFGEIAQDDDLQLLLEGAAIIEDGRLQGEDIFADTPANIAPDKDHDTQICASLFPNLLKNHWVMSGASVALISFLYYCKFVR